MQLGPSESVSGLIQRHELVRHGFPHHDQAPRRRPKDPPASNWVRIRAEFTAMREREDAPRGSSHFDADARPTSAPVKRIHMGLLRQERQFPQPQNHTTRLRSRTLEQREHQSLWRNQRARTILPRQRPAKQIRRAPKRRQARQRRRWPRCALRQRRHGRKSFHSPLHTSNPFSTSAQPRDSDADSPHRRSNKPASPPCAPTSPSSSAATSASSPPPPPASWTRT